MSSRPKKKNAPASAGIGYGGDASKDQKVRKDAMKKAAKEETERGKEQQKLLKQSHKTLDEVEPDEELLSLIKEVLRNQVPTEWSKRRKLYGAALECCNLIAQHHPKLLGAIDDDEALLSSLEEFAQHADLLSKYDKSYNDAADTKFIATILKCRQEAVAASKAVIQQPEMSVMDPHEHYRQALRPLRFELVEDLVGHSFRTRARDSSMNMKRLFRELTTYKTSLPIEYGSSIFVRAMENRLDLLRVCIVGPDDTPYGNGAFIFDIYLNKYPQKAPQVKYLTTGGGRYRFNPNLYQCGKVCLSLLGTWAGPGWVSGESTLLQVLISIQSLILVNDPYFNEPGYQASQGTPHGSKQSELYNNNIRGFTTEVCILPFMKQPSPYPEFDEALVLHFRNKESVIKKQLFRWWKEKTPKLDSLYVRFLDLLDEERDGRKKTRAVAMPATTTKSRTNDDGVIEIEESDDEKPAPKKFKTTGDVTIVLDDDEDDGDKLSTVPVTSSNDSGDIVVDLT